jgi:predicted Rossmann fold nucleotide-binding protein DprA/Smf involved in DNA uptake
MQRNAVILGLADVVIVVESGPDGGTFAAGKAALADRRPLFVVRYQNPPPSASGNELLLAQGAVPLQKDPRDGLPGLGGVRELLGKAKKYDSPGPGQPRASLFDEIA